jgi:hypothetical protein
MGDSVCPAENNYNNGDVVKCIKSWKSEGGWPHIITKGNIYTVATVYASQIIVFDAIKQAPLILAPTMHFVLWRKAKLTKAHPPESGGLRYDEGKARVDLIAPNCLLGIATVLEYGAKKYAENNWRKGMKWGRVIGSLLRHTYQFMAGEDVDSETGLPHVDHIACNAMFLCEYYRVHKALDDRYKGEKND